MNRVLSIIPGLFNNCQWLVDEMRQNGIELLTDLYPTWQDLPAYAEVLPEVEGIICGGNGRFDAALFDQAQWLEIIAKTGKGTDNIDLVAARQRGIDVTNTGSANANGVAELALLLAMAVLRRVPPMATALRGGVWAPEGDGRELAGRTVGLLGFGAIAQLAAQKFRALGCRVLVYDIRPIYPAAQQAQGIQQVSLEALLAKSDVVSLHLPATEGTRHIIGAEALGAMRPGAVLINTARGALVDEAALYHALTAGTLGGAGLDTFENEPVAGPRPVLSLPNVLCTPHIGGSTHESTQEDCRILTRNLIAHFKGEPMPDLVNG